MHDYLFKEIFMLGKRGVTKGVTQVMLPNMVFGLWIVLGLSKRVKDPFASLYEIH